MRKQHRQAGFTIIEIMIVVTVIGVLAAIVLPTFRLDTARAKVSEAILAFSSCKNTVTEIYMSGSPPGFGEQWGCEVTSPSQYVKDVSVTDEGVITILLTGFNDGRLDNTTISLAPLNSSGTHLTGAGDQIQSWRCGASTDGTDLEVKYLPSSCRGY